MSRRALPPLIRPNSSQPRICWDTRPCFTWGTGLGRQTLPGGVMNPDKLRRNDRALAFVKAFFDVSKPVTVICRGAWTLIDDGVVRGRRLTSYPSLQTGLKNAGAEWVDEEVLVDGNRFEPEAGRPSRIYPEDGRRVRAGRSICNQA